MIVVRDVFQAKYGKGGDLVALFKEAKDKWPTRYADRILTDAGGSFFTVVTETEFDNLAAWEQSFNETTSMPEFSDWFERMTPLVESVLLSTVKSQTHPTLSLGMVGSCRMNVAMLLHQSMMKPTP